MKKLLLLSLGVLALVGISHAKTQSFDAFVESRVNSDYKVKPVSEGLTVQDLLEGFAISYIHEGKHYGGYIGSCGGCTLEAVPGEPNSVIVNNFYEEDSGLSFKFTLRNGKELVYVNNTPSITQRNIELEDLVYINGDYYFTYDDEWVGTIKENSYGDGYIITFGAFAMLKNGYIDFDYQDLGYKIHAYDAFTIETHQTGFVVTDEVCDIYGNYLKSREYNMGFYVTGSGSNRHMWLLNLANNGYCVNGNSKGRFELQIDSDGDFLFEMQPALGGPNIDDYGNYRYAWYWYDYKGYVPGYGVVNNFYGADTDYTGHLPGHNHWAHHVPGGTLKTLVGGRIDVANYTTYNRTTGNNFIYDNTKMYFGDFITPKVEIEMDPRGYGKDSKIGLYFKGKIVPTVCDQAKEIIDHYELHLALGLAISSVAGRSDLVSETGINNGTNLHEAFDYVVGTVPANAPAKKAPDEAVEFHKFIPAERIPAQAFNLDHTLYVKTVYNNGLTPSYHALTPLTTTTTGVESVIGGAVEAGIQVDGTNIAITNSNGNAMISTMAGVVVYEGGDNTVSVEPGMYIVRAGKTVKRVLVK